MVRTAVEFVIVVAEVDSHSREIISDSQQSKLCKYVELREMNCGFYVADNRLN